MGYWACWVLAGSYAKVLRSAELPNTSGPLQRLQGKGGGGGGNSRGTFLRDPYNGEHSMLGSILGSRYPRKLPHGHLFIISSRPVSPSIRAMQGSMLVWVAVKELKLSYYIGKPYYLRYIIYIYTHYGNLM